MICDACHSAAASQVARKRGLDIFRCTACDLHFVSPQPGREAIRRLYAGNPAYAVTRHSALGESTDGHARDLDSTILAASGRRGRFLDIGCSTGSLIYHLRALGWSVEGIDPNEASVEVAQRHGLNARAGGFEEMTTSERYDVVHLGDVIEHLASPRRALQKVRELLAPGGLVVVETPNAESNFARMTLAASRLAGFEWIHAEAPLHLYEFSGKSMWRLLEATGFQPIRTVYRGRMPFAYAVGASGRFDALKQSLKRSGRYRYTPELVPHLPMLALVALGVAPCWLASALLDRLNGRLYKMRVIAARSDEENRPVLQFGQSDGSPGLRRCHLRQSG